MVVSPMTGIVLVLIFLFAVAFVLLCKNLEKLMHKHEDFVVTVARMCTVAVTALTCVGSGTVLLLLIASYFIINNIV